MAHVEVGRGALGARVARVLRKRGRTGEIEHVRYVVEYFAEGVSRLILQPAAQPTAQLELHGVVARTGCRLEAGDEPGGRVGTTAFRREGETEDERLHAVLGVV